MSNELHPAIDDIVGFAKDLECILEHMDRNIFQNEALWHISQAVELLDKRVVTYIVDEENENVIYVDWRK